MGVFFMEGGGTMFTFVNLMVFLYLAGLLIEEEDESNPLKGLFWIILIIGVFCY